MTQERNGGFVNQAGIDIPEGIVIPAREGANISNSVRADNLSERIRGDRECSGGWHNVGLDSPKAIENVSASKVRRMKKNAGIRYMGQPR